MPRMRWYCSIGFVENFIHFPAVQKFLKSVTKLQRLLSS